ncbi:jing [Carabus blaptoides fortunei]
MRTGAALVSFHGHRDQTVAFKMADGLCTEDTVSNVIEKTLVKDYTNIVKCVNTNSVNDISCENVKSFYIDSDSGKLCGKLCGVKGSEAKHEGFLEMPCSPGDEDCRKKRCADRYDSSESSDSGVAVLSCTDCSYSGGSTASSDITDPGSPFSTASSHSEDSSSQQQPPKMPPNLSAHHPPWPWSGGDSPPLKRATTNEKTASPKRLKTETSQSTNVTTHPPLQHMKNCIVSKTLPAKNTNCAKVQQGKITEYFKSQMKAKKEPVANMLVKMNNAANHHRKVTAVDPVTNMQKYFTLIDGPKVILNGKCPKFPVQDLYRKIDIRTLTVAAPVKKVMLDTKTKKISQVISLPRKILPAPKLDKGKQVPTIPITSSSAVKFTPLRYPHHQDIMYLTSKSSKPPDNFFLTASSPKLPNGNKASMLPVAKRITPNTNTVMFPLQKVMPVTNLNLKVSSTVVPIAKLNMPSKLNGSNVNINLSSLSVETAVPTVPSAKPKSLAISDTPLLLSPKLHSTISSTTTITKLRDLLAVSVAPTSTHVEQQKSPILSQPKTIRFPAKQTQSETQKDARRSNTSDSGLCRWSECQAQFDTSGALLEHLQIKHVISQATQEHYVCLWVGCKVHGRTSCSRSWLERHVLSHAGNKPFRCIVDGCGCRFSSQQTLERHVNSHFNGTENGSNGSNKKTLESGTTKLFKRNGKKLRYRRQPWSARMFDFFDAGIMEGLQHRLVTMTEKRTLGEVSKSPGDIVTLQSTVLARRVEADGSRKVLLRWHPPNVIPDEWTLESESINTRTVSISTLQPSALDVLQETLFPPTSGAANQPPRQKQRRKCVVKKS